MNYNSLLGSKLAKYFNKKYGIITYSGTLAIEVALKSLKLKRKSKVLISSNVCYSIINTVLKLGLVPVIKTPNNGLFFTNDDIDVVIDKEIIDCILLVHQFGILNNISKRKYKKLNIKIIEDVAQFECGKTIADKYKGIVLDKEVHEKVIKNIVNSFKEINYNLKNITFSPVKGGNGNIEYLAYFTKEEINSTINFKDLVSTTFKIMK